jgi:hypothetical protein
MCLYVQDKGTRGIRSRDDIMVVWKKFEKRDGSMRTPPRNHVETPFQNACLKRGVWLTADGTAPGFVGTCRRVYSGNFHAYRNQKKAEACCGYWSQIIPCFMYTKSMWWGNNDDVCAPHIYICTPAQAKDPYFNPDDDGRIWDIEDGEVELGQRRRTAATCAPGRSPRRRWASRPGGPT